MALIHFYNGLKEDHTQYVFNGKIKNHIKNINWENAIILRNGYRINADYEVGENDIIYIRKTPAAMTTVAIIAGTAALIAGGVAVGIALYQKKKALAQMEEAQAAAKAANEKTNALPFIKGARNQIATGRTFPYLIGRSFFSPYILCSSHFTIEGDRGETQYFNVVLEAAYNNIIVEKLQLGESPLKTWDTTEPQNGVYNFDAGGRYYDDNNLVEIQQSARFETENFNKKIICTELSKEIPHAHASGDAEEMQRIQDEWQAGVTQDLPNNAQAVELIVLFDGCQKYADGRWQEKKIILQPQWTNNPNDEEPTWHDFDTAFIQGETQSNTFTYNTKKQMRFIARQTFSPADTINKNISIRVRRTTPKEEGSAKENVFLLAVQTTIYDPKKSDTTQLTTAEVLEPAEREKCCRIGIKIKASENTETNIDNFNIIEQGCARIWDGETWSQTKEPTRNLAAWILELLTSNIHKPSKYYDEELDLETFGALYEYCEAQGFYADGVITNGRRKKQIIDTLLKNANAALVMNPMTGLIEVAIDNGRDYSIALLNSENIISITKTKDLKRRTDGRRVKYINGAAGYDADAVTFMKDGGTYDPATDTLSELAPEYITEYGHVFKYAWRDMAEENAQPWVVTAKVGREAAYYPLFSRIEVEHRTFSNGAKNAIIAALVWRNSYLQEIKLDRKITLIEGREYGLIINCTSETGHGILYIRVAGEGSTDTLEVLDTIRSNREVVPAAGNFCSYGELDEYGEFTTITKSMKITVAEENDTGYTLTLVDYNPALYEYGPLPEYKSNITKAPNNNTQTVEQQREYMTEGETEAKVSGAAQAAVDVITTGTRFTNMYPIGNTRASLEEILAKIDDDAKQASASISISEAEILLQVEDGERELRGLLSVQAGAVQALVEGGGAIGQLSLSLELPALINIQQRGELIAASTEEKVNAVYGAVENTDYYGIKPTATNNAIKTLWDDAVRARLLASQLDLSATQVKIAAERVIITDGADAGETMIEGGKIRAALIEVSNLLAQKIQVKDRGVVTSENYNGTIDEETGIITEYGDRGWALDNAGGSDFVNIHASGGVFNDITLTGKIGNTTQQENDFYCKTNNERSIFFVYDIKETYIYGQVNRENTLKAVIIICRTLYNRDWGSGLLQYEYTFNTIYKTSDTTVQTERHDISGPFEHGYGVDVKVTDTAGDRLYYSYLSI